MGKKECLGPEKIYFTVLLLPYKAANDRDMKFLTMSYFFHFRGAHVFLYFLHTASFILFKNEKPPLVYLFCVSPFTPITFHQNSEVKQQRINKLPKQARIHEEKKSPAEL